MLSAGRRVVLTEGRPVDLDGVLLAHGTSTLLLTAPPPNCAVDRHATGGPPNLRSTSRRGIAVAGKSKHASRMADHVGEPVEAACPITHAGGTAGRIGGAVGGAVGAGIAGTGRSGQSDVEIPQFAWLGLGTGRFTITKASAMGKPTGDPVAQIGYDEVTAAELTTGKASILVDLDLADGRHVAFEIQSRGTGKPSIGVVELLRDRCTGA